MNTLWVGNQMAGSEMKKSMKSQVEIPADSGRWFTELGYESRRI